MSKVETVEYGGATLVTGLLWQPLAGSNPSERLSEIKGYGKELNLDLQVLQRENLCVGMAKSSASKAGAAVKRGAVSLAAALSQKMHEQHNARDFILVMEIDSGVWYYLAQKDGVVLPDGDQVYGEEDVIKSRFYQDASLGEWTHSIVPGHWGISGSLEAPQLEQILPLAGKGKGKFNPPKEWRLEPISISAGQLLAANAKPIVVLVVVALALTVGFDQFKKWQRDQSIAEAARLAAELAAMQPAAIPRPRPWGDIPHAADLMAGCMRATAGVQLFPGNWDLVGVNCSNGVVTISWRPRAYGWIEHLKQVVPDVVISLDGSLASSTKALPQFPAANDEDLYTANERLVVMYAAAQRFGVKFGATPAVSQAPQLLPGQGGVPQEVPLWEEVGWKAEGVTLPETVLAALDGNGFRLRSMSGQWVNGQFIWTMEGSQYVRK